MFQIEADPEADAVYIHISESPVAYTKEIDEDIVADYSADGVLVGVEYMQFSKMTDKLQWAASLQA